MSVGIGALIISDPSQYAISPPCMDINKVPRHKLGGKPPQTPILLGLWS